MLAILARDDAAARAKNASDLGAALATMLGPRLTPEDAKRVRATIDEWYGARDDWATLALTLTPTERGAYADVAASDPARAARGVREAVDLLAHVPALRDPLGAWLHVRDVTSQRVPTFPGAARVRRDVRVGQRRADGARLDAERAGSARPRSAPSDAEARPRRGAAPAPRARSSRDDAGGRPRDALRARDDGRGRRRRRRAARPISRVQRDGRGRRRLGRRAAPDRTALRAAPSLWATMVASDSSLPCLVKSFF